MTWLAEADQLFDVQMQQLAELDVFIAVLRHCRFQLGQSRPVRCSNQAIVLGATGSCSAIWL